MTGKLLVGLLWNRSAGTFRVGFVMEENNRENQEMNEVVPANLRALTDGKGLNVGFAFQLISAHAMMLQAIFDVGDQSSITHADVMELLQGAIGRLYTPRAVSVLDDGGDSPLVDFFIFGCDCAERDGEKAGSEEPRYDP